MSRKPDNHECRCGSRSHDRGNRTDRYREPGPAKRVAEAMRLMRKRDPQTAEDGFHLLRPHAAEHVDELLHEFEQERADQGLRCWLLELIGEARSPAALPTLAAQSHSEDESLRFWAIHGLELLDTREARTALYRARANGTIP
ncbi:HEAT repeat domain-containing protein [Amycolatopsis sp. CA-230715]|uniref:HEAT repeat domain-containing protein n=1 Tax=Amycolatopsis sp. CA-230715 TaxID=2745196 RepID=UPI001C03099F|nr:HEAT repeat domain-containing protein [Amycolatopsis sp. CA-230715]QWF79084.1 hypothetical protein HUW46_02491 [Amycolatopsis sp. CA-230715]